jgi:hypothetical protein
VLVDEVRRLRASAVVPAADRAALRDRIRRAVCEAEGFAWDSDMLEPDEYGDHADMVLAALPELVYRTAEDHRLALSDALGLGTGAPWEAIYDRATELGLPPIDQDPVARRLGLLPAPADRAAVLREAADIADEVVPPDLPRDDRDQGRADAAADIRKWADHIEREELRRVTVESAVVDRVAAETPPAETGCAHCGKPVQRITGTLTAWWVHDPGGHTICHPQQPNSPRATPGPAVEAQPEVPGHEWCKCRSCWGWFVEEHPGEDLDELGRDLRWWSGLPEHRDAPTGVGAQPGKDTETPQPKEA